MLSMFCLIINCCQLIFDLTRSYSASQENPKRNYCANTLFIFFKLYEIVYGLIYICFNSTIICSIVKSIVNIK